MIHVSQPHETTSERSNELVKVDKYKKSTGKAPTMIAATPPVLSKPGAIGPVRVREVEVVEYQPDFDRLEWDVAVRLGAPDNPPGSDFLVAAWASTPSFLN